MSDAPDRLDAQGNPITVAPDRLDAQGNPVLGVVAKSEPDTWWGGALASAKDTASRTGGGILRGALATFDPRTYAHAMDAKQAAEARGITAAAGGPPESSGHPIDDLKAIGAQLSTPEGGGEAIGGLLTGLAVGRAGPAVGSAVKRGSLRMMQSALKPTKALENARAGAGYGSKEAISQAVLDEGRIVSPGSAAKAQDALDTTDDAAHTAIQQGAGAGVTVSPRPVAAAIRNEASAGPFGKQINAAPDVAAIEGVRDSFVNNPHIPRVTIRRPVTTTTTNTSPILDEFGRPITTTQTNTTMQAVGQVPQPLNAELAHEFAMNTGKNLKGKFGRLGGATVEAEKAGREEITSQLRSKIPELAPLWDQEARQITTRDALDAAVARRANTDPIGLGGVMGLARNPKLFLGAMADRSALVKSIVAQGMNKAANSSITPAALRAAILARLQKETEMK